MNRRSYGLVSIVKNEEEVTEQQGVCQPEKISIEESGVDISSWYDSVNVHLMYVCARTIYSSRENAPLVDDISDFMLGFVYNDTIIQNRDTFAAVNKFKKLKELNSMNGVHNIPTYTVEIIGELSTLMHSQMLDYRITEIAQENLLAMASGRAQDMQVYFDTVEMQQQTYFETEQSIMDQIWTSSQINWNFTFDHRNGIEDQISGNLDAIAEEMFEMQRNELQHALEQAEQSKKHIQDVIDQYKSQVTRASEKVKGSITVQTSYIERMKTNAAEMDVQFEKFDQAVQEWQHKQEVKAVWGIFKAVVTLGVSIATAVEDPTAIGDAISAGFDLVDLMVEIFEMIQSFNDVQDMINSIDFGNIDNINLALTTKFKDALQSAVDMKLKGPDFDVIERTATVKVDAMNAATNNEIGGIDDLMLSMVAVSDVAHLLINEAADFADSCLMLAEKNDQLAVAKADMDRATAEIEHIKQMLTDLEAEREKFENDRNASKEEYEKKLQELLDNYLNLTDEQKEKYKQEIQTAYDNFKTTFNILKESYNEKIFNVMNGIQSKFYGLRFHSMNQRAMIMSLYLDYCDADFYHTFRTCDIHNMPYMSDELEVLLEKLIEIKWNTVTSVANIPGTPIAFKGDFEIVDDGNLLAQKPNVIVQKLKASGETEINLRDLDTENYFDSFWRVRIQSLTVLLFDKNDYPIQSSGTTFGEGIHVFIRFPTIFTDKDMDRQEQTFLATNFACNSDYITEDAEITMGSQCIVIDEFSSTNYKTAPDGVFNVKILNADTIRMEDVYKLKIHFAGSSITTTSEQAHRIMEQQRLAELAAGNGY